MLLSRATACLEDSVSRPASKMPLKMNRPVLKSITKASKMKRNLGVECIFYVILTLSLCEYLFIFTSKEVQVLPQDYSCNPRQ